MRGEKANVGIKLVDAMAPAWYRAGILVDSATRPICERQHFAAYGISIREGGAQSAAAVF